MRPLMVAGPMLRGRSASSWAVVTWAGRGGGGRGGGEQACRQGDGEDPVSVRHESVGEGGSEVGRHGDSEPLAPGRADQGEGPAEGGADPSAH